MLKSLFIHFKYRVDDAVVIVTRNSRLHLSWCIHITTGFLNGGIRWSDRFRLRSRLQFQHISHENKDMRKIVEVCYCYECNCLMYDTKCVFVNINCDIIRLSSALACSIHVEQLTDFNLGFWQLYFKRKWSASFTIKRSNVMCNLRNVVQVIWAKLMRRTTGLAVPVAGCLHLSPSISS